MYIALDIGGTNIRVSSYENLHATTCLQKVLLSSADNQTYQEAIDHIAATIRNLSDGQAVEGIAVSMTGTVDPKQKIIRISAAYPDWNGKKLSEDLGKVFDCPNAIENDAICAGLSEKFAGKGKDYSSMGFIIVGTGVGGMRVHSSQGKTLVYPTEFGHIPIIADGEKCLCGQRGCIQAYASGKGIAALYDENAEHINNKEAWIMTSQRLTQALMNFLHMDYVETFIFGGGVALNQESFVDKLLKNITVMLMDHFPKRLPTLQTSQFLDDAGSIGSLMLLRDDLEIINMNYR